MNQRSRSEGSIHLDSEPITRTEARKPDPLPSDKEEVEEAPVNTNENPRLSMQNSKKGSVVDPNPAKASFNVAEEQEKFYKSAFQDPYPNSGQTGLNDTISLNITSNFIVYKPRTESSGWFTEAQEIMGIKGKEHTESQAGGNQDVIGKCGPPGVDLYDDSASAILPPTKFGHNRAVSNPFGHQLSPQNSSHSIRSSSNLSSYSQPQSIISEKTQKALEYRVKTALLRLKEWEERRVEDINNHRVICEHIFEYITDRILQAKRGLKTLFKFFIDRVNAERAFVRMSLVVPKLDAGFMNPGEEAIPTELLPKAMKEADDYHMKYIEKSRIISDFMEDEIVKGILDKEEKNFRDHIDVLVNQYKKLRANLNRENEITTKVTNEYVNLYKKSLSFQKMKEDLFAFEIHFLRQARRQMISQKELGQFTVFFIKEIQKFEKMRLESFSQAMKLYTQSMNQLYGGESSKLVVGTLSEYNAQEECDKVYALNKLLKERDMDFLNQVFATVSEITMTELNIYLNSIEFQKITTNPLMLHQCQASVEENGLMLGTKNTNVALTVDRNIVVYDLDTETFDYRIHKIIRISQIIFKQIKETSNIIEFIETKKKLLGNSLKHINIIFRNREEKQNFMDLYSKFSY